MAAARPASAEKHVKAFPVESGALAAADGQNKLLKPSTYASNSPAFLIQSKAAREAGLQPKAVYRCVGAQGLGGRRRRSWKAPAQPLSESSLSWFELNSISINFRRVRAARGALLRPSLRSLG